MWDPQDECGFQQQTSNMRGQITVDTEMGSFLCELASDLSYHRFLEIGTWNGLGSTKCFHEGFLKRLSTVNDFFFLDSLEVNIEKCEVARKFYNDFPEIRIHNMTLLDNPPTWEDIVKELGQKWSDSQRETFHTYFQVDMDNLVQCQVFHPAHERENGFLYDVILLDGSELLSYLEFVKICDWTKIIILDDCTCPKNMKVYNELIGDANWKLLRQNMEERNGYAAFQRMTS